MIYYHIIASLTTNDLIGIDNKLLIECGDDLKRFYRLTTATYPESNGIAKPKNMLIMGHRTWLSLPEQVRPFAKRMSIVVSATHMIEEGPSVVLCSTLEDAFEYCEGHMTGRVFVIGGSMIFERCWSHFSHFCRTLYLTRFCDETQCHGRTHTFPRGLLQNTCIHYQGSKVQSDCIINTPIGKTFSTISQYICIYQNVLLRNQGENEYLILLQKVLREGTRHSSRNSVVHSLFGERMVFDLEQGFPLLTTKKMGYKTILRELLWFMKGSTDNRELQDKHVHIWDKNASQEFLKGKQPEHPSV